MTSNEGCGNKIGPYDCCTIVTGDAKETCADSFWARIYASGPIEVAKQVLRQECLREGLCVTIEETTFIYTGGEEAGYVVGFVNYPRFPSGQDAIWDRAVSVAKLLLEETYQHSILIMSPAKTLWITKRNDW